MLVLVSFASAKILIARIGYGVIKLLPILLLGVSFFPFSSYSSASAGSADANKYKNQAVAKRNKKGTSAPEQTVREFYQAITDKNYRKVAELRPGYALSKCEKILKVNLTKVDRHYTNDNVAIIYLRVGYEEGGVPKHFSGHVKLDLRNKKWVIVSDSYDSASDLQAYQKKYGVTGGQPKDTFLKPANPATRLASSDPLTKHAPPARAVTQPSSTFEASSRILASGVESVIAKPHDSGPSTSGLVQFDALTFGSRAVLETCWSPQELLGIPGEEKIRKPVPVSIEPPARLLPTNYSTHYPLSPELQNSIRRVTPNGGRKPIALTFDLCETANEIAGYDGSIIDYLRKNNTKATFFAGGKWMRSHPERTMQLMADPLFEIGNHTWTHGNLRVLTGPKMLNQIQWTQAQYEVLWEELEARFLARGGNPAEMERIPRVPLTFRFPFGTCNTEVLRTLARLGLPAIQWDVVSGDPAIGQTAEAIAHIVLSQTKPGSIVICHANGRGHQTARALPKFISGLKAMGYEFVTVSELLALGKVVSKQECYELRPGDNLRYDELFGTGTGEPNSTCSKPIGPR